MGDWQMSLMRTGTDAPELLTALRAEVPLPSDDDRLSESLWSDHAESPVAGPARFRPRLRLPRPCGCARRAPRW